MHNVILALGSNVADSQHQLEKALRLCEPFVSIRQTTPVVVTAAIGITAPPFANQMARGITPLPLQELNEKLKDLEQQLGRKHGGNIIAIDLDIMQYDEQRLHPDDWDRQYIKTLITHL